MVVGSSRWFFQGVYPTGFVPKFCRLDISTLDIIPPFRFGVWMVCCLGNQKNLGFVTIDFLPQIYPTHP